MILRRLILLYFFMLADTALSKIVDSVLKILHRGPAGDCGDLPYRGIHLYVYNLSAYSYTNQLVVNLAVVRLMDWYLPSWDGIVKGL